MLTLYSPDNSKLMEVEALERRGNELLINGEVKERERKGTVRRRTRRLRPAPPLTSLPTTRRGRSAGGRPQPHSRKWLRGGGAAGYGARRYATAQGGGSWRRAPCELPRRRSAPP